MGRREPTAPATVTALLLDTHALIWWLGGDARLGAKARTAIRDRKNDVFVSAASAWECAIKVASGKLPQAAPLISSFRDVLEDAGFLNLDIASAHALAAGALPRHHGDPFDRMLIAQALIEDMTLVSNERAFAAYRVPLIW